MVSLLQILPIVTRWPVCAYVPPPKESIWHRLRSSETEIKTEGDNGTQGSSGCRSTKWDRARIEWLLMKTDPETCKEWSPRGCVNIFVFPTIDSSPYLGDLGLCL